MKSEVEKCAEEISKIMESRNLIAKLRSSQRMLGRIEAVIIKTLIDPDRFAVIKKELSEYQGEKFKRLNGDEEGDTKNKRLFITYTEEIFDVLWLVEKKGNDVPKGTGEFDLFCVEETNHE